MCSGAELLSLATLKTGKGDLLPEEPTPSPQKRHRILISSVIVCEGAQKTFLRPLTLNGWVFLVVK